jgi:CheY-like chemotaxis protein/two-component sensor histidine kinase
VFAKERAAREQAEHASRMKDEFLATLSHELRTPLSAVLSWTYVLRRLGGRSAELLTGIDAIERNARMQSRLIEELLDMSRIIAGNVQLDLQPLQPAATVAAATSALRAVADAKQIRLELALDEDVGIVMADPVRLQQVVWNLLSNALKFTDSGGVVRVTLLREGSEAVVRVEDDGEGISPAFLPHVFERFRQADGSITRRHGGLGLGLAIVRHLVELHGGRVSVRSDGPGHGAVFEVRLSVADDTSMPRDPEAASGMTMSPASPSAGELDGLCIVLVDDEADGREAIGRILSQSGAAIVAAGTAEEALAALQDSRPDVLISDIGMPRVDGYGLLEQARTLGHLLPAIALTAFARAEDRTRALAAGYALHLAKPVDPLLLVSSVSRLARGGAAAP